MWNNSWSFREGAVIGVGLLATSLALQFTVGQIDWALTAWPINAVLLALLIFAIAIMHVLRKKVYLFAWLSTYTSAISAMTFAVLVTIVLGLIAQSPSADSDVPWYNHLLSSWPFVLTYLWLTISLGLTILRVGSRRWTWRTVAFMLNHLGLFIVLVTATLGNADMQRLNMMVGKESMGYGPQAIAYDDLSPMHEPVEMDFALVLKDFEIEYYMPDSLTAENFMLHPKSFTSYVTVYTKDGDDAKLWGDTIILVNKPLNVNGWKIYQYGYDNSMGVHTRYSEFQLVRDPWLPWVYLGIFMMLAGALTLFFTSPLPKSTHNS